MEPITKIEFVGEIGACYPSIEGVAYTLQEAVRMMQCFYPDIKNYLAQSESCYRLFLKDETNTYPINQINPEFPVAGKTLMIIPAPVGSGDARGLLTGLALVTIGVLTGGTSLIVAGAVMAAQSLFFGYGDAPTDEEQKRSEILGTGNLNTAEGNPIPVVYGHQVMVKGLQVLSFGIKSEYTAL